MDLGYDVIVTITGIVLVFLILVLLMAIITLEGKMFDAMEAGIPGDVVAAIMAAIYSMGNGKYVLKAVRRGKNGWGKAGVNDTTAPF